MAGAGVAELADARDSKSRVQRWMCGFDSLLRHTLSPDFPPVESLLGLSLIFLF